MSVSTQSAAGVAAEKSIVDLKGMWIGLGLLNCFFLLVRIYEQIYGWRAGLDSFAPEFQSYWMSILAIMLYNIANLEPTVSLSCERASITQVQTAPITPKTGRGRFPQLLKIQSRPPDCPHQPWRMR